MNLLKIIGTLNYERKCFPQAYNNKYLKQIGIINAVGKVLVKKTNI